MELERLEVRLAPYTLLGSVWATHEITYSIAGDNTPERSGLVAEAFRAWASAAPLHFRQVPDAGPAATPSGPNYDGRGLPDVRVYFDQPLSRPTVGVAYGPADSSFGLGGDVFLGAIDGIELPVITHEIGHALGLGHSDDRSAIMFPIISRGRGPGLAPDDAAGLRDLYGAGAGTVTPLPAAPDGPPLPAAPFAGFAGLVSSVRADVDADGADDLIRLAQGASGHVKAFSGAAGTLIFSELLYPGFVGGCQLAAGPGSFAALAEGSQGHLVVASPGGVLASVYAFPGYQGEVTLAALDGGYTLSARLPGGQIHDKTFDHAGSETLSEIGGR